MDHAQTLACVLLGVFKHQKIKKEAKLSQYGQRIWGITPGPGAVDKAIDQTEAFFRSLGMKTRLKEYGVGTENFEKIASRIQSRGMKLGEHANIGKNEIIEILNLSL
ncbi:Alcohol dehydrogenase YqhD [bioreactor metagenome]|uniref:Alcohol dehydrogenase YqhD n=1 Tax=bioreactor metagenome TaxID=1076179 RepID=A0A645H5Y9_9ZZZZ